MMNGQQFIETLQQLGYTKELEGSSFDWLFDNENLKPFLSWFCTNLHSHNVLTTDERLGYRALEASEAGVLEGAHLDRALQTLPDYNTDSHLTDQQLRDDIKRLQEDVAQSKRRKKKLIQHRNRLSSHISKRSSQLNQIGGAMGKCKERYSTAVQQCQADDSGMDTSLGDMARPLTALIDLYQPTSPDTHHVTPFLSQCNLDNFHQHEGEFTQQLTAFTKKQFFDGIAGMAGQNETSQYEVLDATDPQMLLVREEHTGAVDSNSREFARLQAIYPSSETQYITYLVSIRSKQATLNMAQAADYPASETQYIASLVSVRGKQATLNMAQSILSDLYSGAFVRSIPVLSCQVEEVGSSLSRIKKETANIYDSTLTPLIAQNSFSQISSILTGDYNLKISRQDYFTSNQDQVIEQLLEQRSRNEFLTMAYEVEARSNRDLYRLIEVIRGLLSEHHKIYTARMEHMNEIIESQQKQDRTTIDSRDTCTLRLAQLIGNLDGEKANYHGLYVAYTSLIDGLDVLCKGKDALDETVCADIERHQLSLGKLESSQQSLEDTIYANNSTTTGLPQLTPRAITKSMAQLTHLLDTLEKAIMDIVKDRDGKSKMLRSDPLLSKERHLWVNFFTNPPKLEKAAADLKERLEALSLQ